MKGILKGKTTKGKSLPKVEAQSHSIGAVRWPFPDEAVQVHSSAPSGLYKSCNVYSTRSQQKHHQQSLKDLRSLQECVRFLNHWKVQVAQVCKKESDPDESSSRWLCGGSDQPEDPCAERSLEESRKLILQWADELNSVDMLSKENPWLQDRFKHSEADEQRKDSQNELVEQRVMEWAKELQSVSESCGMLGEELTQTLRLLGLRKKRLVSLMPLLEFITWSLLKEDSKNMVSQLWLPAKQRSWKAGTPQYIPNSVWNWITSAAVDVSLDPMTNHPWLQISDDQKQVQESLWEVDVAYTPQRFDGWPCVLGWQGYAGGRCYWEVDLSNNSHWRVGVTTGSSERQGRFPMKPSSSYWTLWRSTRQFYACTEPETALPLTLVPRKLGIYLDYEEGQISFYNVKNKLHIFTFTGNFRGKLYPLFAPLDGKTLITVSSPKNASPL
ncbi:E3 ubiquitin-protein ligase TRIM39 [Electrophorus electricus]|uniref:E3 ubiquitin-protein ligase TRIM39 n=1 Tax=Electrophorus electricus TaxID=8005 RepID=UPI0015D028A1|nr:E3 ubiquitin-protein ligase TRIM39 [Electrophorus electricus]